MLTLKVMEDTLISLPNLTIGTQDLLVATSAPLVPNTGL